MKKKLLIFPFTYCNREIVMYRKYMEEYTLVAAVVQNKAELEQIAEKSEKFEDILITEKFEDVEVEIHKGGQPVYPYLFSVE